MPITTFAAFVRRFARNNPAAYFFLWRHLPQDTNRPGDSVSPLMFQSAMQTLRRYGAISKVVLHTPYQSIFYALYDEAQRWQQTTGTRVEIAQDIEGPQSMAVEQNGGDFSVF